MERFGDWNLEDRLGSWRRTAIGVFLLLFGTSTFISATASLWSFLTGGINGGGGGDALNTYYYYLLVPMTLPATIIFVYLNWLSVSFFKNA